MKLLVGGLATNIRGRLQIQKKVPSSVRIQLVGIFNNPGGDPADSPPRGPIKAPLGMKNESSRKYINMGVKICVLDMENPNLILFFS